MNNAIHPTLYNVRTLDDISVIEENALERYNVPHNWLILELLGLSSVYEIINTPEQPPQPVKSVLPKRPSLMDNIVTRSVPLFLRL